MTIVWGDYRGSLDRDFANACDATLGPLPDTWVVTSGFRSMTEQASLYSEGRDAQGTIVDPSAVVTYATPGSSAHNWGLAIDVALQMGTGSNLTWNYSGPQWPLLWAAVRASPWLHSGMDFPPGEADPPHIEMVNWWQHESAPTQSET